MTRGCVIATFFIVIAVSRSPERSEGGSAAISGKQKAKLKKQSVTSN